MSIVKHRGNRVAGFRAFTLVELLVVIAIIALLISILLPSLARAREQSKSMKCLGNLHDIMAASIAYASSDPSEYIIPLIPTLRGCSEISASRRAWGGKSGLHTMTDQNDPALPADQQMYSTKRGFGPDKRPLNNFVFKGANTRRSYAEIESMSNIEAEQDEKIDMPVFKCPSDVGYQSSKDGSTGIFLYADDDRVMTAFKVGEPLYDIAGNSYATDSLLTISGGDCDTVISWGAMLRPYSQIPHPTEQYVYLDGNAFYSCFWNKANVCGCSGSPDLEGYAWGWHGRNRTHNAAYADGHAKATLFEIRTDVTDFDSTTGQIVHSGAFDLRGGTAYSFLYSPGDVPFPWTHNMAATFCLRGDGWKNSSMPAPPTAAPGLLCGSNCGP